MKNINYGINVSERNPLSSINRIGKESNQINLAIRLRFVSQAVKEFKELSFKLKFDPIFKKGFEIMLNNVKSSKFALEEIKTLFIWNKIFNITNKVKHGRRSV